MWISKSEFNRLAAEVNHLAEIVYHNEDIKKYAMNCVRNKEGFIKIGSDVAIVSFSFIENIIKKRQNKDKAKSGCIVVCASNKEEFEKAINNNLEQGYKIISSSCNTKEFKAIMCDKRFSE